MASLIDLSGSKIAIGDTNYPATHDSMIDDIQDGVNDGITTANSAEALANATSAGIFTATSTSPLTPAVASKTFTLAGTADSRAYIVGSEVKASYTTDPDEYMKGVVTSYSGNTLVVNVTEKAGITERSAWSIGLSASDGLTAIVQDTAPVLGGDLDCSGKVFEASSYNQDTDATPASASTHTFNYTNGDMQKVTCPAAGTLTLDTSNFVTNKVCIFIIDLVNGGNCVVDYNAGWLLGSAESPAYTEAGTDRLMLIKDANNVFSLSVVELDIKVIP